MKKTAISLVLILVSFTIYSQTTFSQLLKGENDEIIYDVIQNNNNEFLLVGYERESYFDYGWENGTIYLFSNNGELINKKERVKDDSLFVITDIFSTYNSDYVSVGYASENTIPETYDNIVFTKYNQQIDVLSEKKYKLPFDSIAYLITRKINDNYVSFISYFSTEKYNTVNNFIVKFNSVGDTLFTKQLPLAENRNFSIVYDILVQENNKYYLPARGFSNTSITQILETDSMFNIIDVSDCLQNMDGFPNLKKITDTTFIIAGSKVHYDNKFQNNQIDLLIIDTNFNVLNEVDFGSPDTTDGTALRNSLTFDENENIIVGGTHHYNFDIFGNSNNNLVLLSLDRNLNLNWQKHYGGDACYRLYHTLTTNDLGYILVGTRYDHSKQFEEHDIYILKLDAQGNITHINGEATEQETSFLLYPNPASVQITVQKPENVAECQIEIYNLQGQIIREQLISQSQTQINTSHFPSGIYTYRIYGETNMLQTGKFVVKH